MAYYLNRFERYQLREKFDKALASHHRGCQGFREGLGVKKSGIVRGKKARSVLASLGHRGALAVDAEKPGKDQAGVEA